MFHLFFFFTSFNRDFYSRGQFLSWNRHANFEVVNFGTMYLNMPFSRRKFKRIKMFLFFKEKAAISVIKSFLPVCCTDISPSSLLQFVLLTLTPWCSLFPFWFSHCINRIFCLS